MCMMCDIKKSIVRHQQLFIKNLFDQEKTTHSENTRKMHSMYSSANLLIVSNLPLYAETRTFLCAIRSYKTMVETTQSYLTIS